MAKHRPFSKTEMKILIYNKMKIKGLSYNQAYKELSKEIASVIENSNKAKKSDKKTFKEEFKEMKCKPKT